MRASPLSIALTTLALAGAPIGTAEADTVIGIPGAAKVKVPLPSKAKKRGGPPDVQVPSVEVTAPGRGSRPPVTVRPGHAGPGTTQPVSTPDLPVTAHPDPRTKPRTPAQPHPRTKPPTPAHPDPRTKPPPAQPTTPAAQTPTTATTTTQPAATAPAAAAPTVPAAKSRTVAAIRRSSKPRAQAPRRHRSAASKPAAVADVTTPAPAAQRTTAAPTPDPAPTNHRPAPHAGKTGTIRATIADVVDLLPGWVLAVFLGFAALAAGMAVNAYLSSRRARRLAVQRAELVDDVGRLQAALLAPVPSTPDDVSFSVAYRPAAGLAAGGDFYDVFELDPSRTAMLLGDVSGHGRESVAHAALVRYTLRTFIAAGHGPAQAIALTDRCLDGHMEGQFATVIAAIYDHDAEALTYAKAGHHPPLVLGASDASTMASSSPPIGAGLGAVPTDVTMPVAPGATVCFFTDGLVEARNHGTPIGAERVEQLLADAPDDAEALIAAVAAEADALNDDLAVCLLHRPADASEARCDLVGSDAGGGVGVQDMCPT